MLTLTLASALVASTMAQSTSVTSMFLYGAEGDSIVASVMSAAPEATSYFVTCPVGTDGDDCGFGGGMTYVLGPTTYAIHATESGAFTMDLDCKVASETMTCVEVDAGPEANDPGTTSALVSDLSDDVSRVTITAGLDLLSGGGSASTTASASATSGTAQPSASTSAGPSATGSTASSSPSSPSSSGSTASSSGESPASATGMSTSTTTTKSSSSSKSTASGAAPRVNGNIVAVAGGMVALSGLMMVL